MKVSVVVITYNQEQTIGQTLDSILAQQYDFELEILIGEDDSLDNTRQICEKYADQYPNIIRLMPKADNKGLMINYADTVSSCTGKYLAVCAGDDFWNGTTYLQQKVDFLETNPQYGIVHTDHDILHINNDGTQRLEVSHRKNRKQVLHSDNNVFVELMGDDPSGIAALTMVVRMDLIHQYVDLYHYIELGFMMEDLPTWLELSQHTLFKYLNISSGTYRLANGSACNNATDFARNERFKQNALRVKLWFLEKYPQYQIDPKHLKDLFYRQMLLAAFRNSDTVNIAKYVALWQPTTLKQKLVRFIIKTPILNSIYHSYIIRYAV